MLQEYTDDQELHRLIGSTTFELSVYDRALIEAVRKIVSVKTEMLDQISTQIQLLASVAGVNVDEEMAKFKRRITKPWPSEKD